MVADWQERVQRALRGYTSGIKPPGFITLNNVAVRNQIEAVFAQYANVVTSPASLPPGAVERPSQGPFYDPITAFKYLNGGGMLFDDQAGNPTVNPLIWILRRRSLAFQSIVWDIYIDEDISP